MTLHELRALNCEKTTVYVFLRFPLFGHAKARLIGTGRLYARIMLADGRTLSRVSPEDIVAVV